MPMTSETHDMEISCVGRTEFGEECTFKCRIKVDSHEEGLRQAVELHDKQRMLQEQEEDRNPEDPEFESICDQFEPDVYPAPCWDCYMDEVLPML